MSQSGAPLWRRLLLGLLALPDHRWLDRLVRGRAWIPVLGVFLTGIVFMQVEVLKLGASVGRSLNQATLLESRNQQLRAEVSALSNVQRIEQIAIEHGMVMPQPGEVTFVSAHSGGVQRAISAISPPSPASFIQKLAAEQAANNDPTTATTPTPNATAAAQLASTGTVSTTASSTAATPATGATPASTTAGSTAGTPTASSSTAAPAATESTSSTSSPGTTADATAAPATTAAVATPAADGAPATTATATPATTVSTNGAASPAAVTPSPSSQSTESSSTDGGTTAVGAPAGSTTG